MNRAMVKQCWSCKGTRSVRIRPVKGLISGSVRESCMLCKGTGYVTEQRLREYRQRQRRLLAMDRVIVERMNARLAAAL